MSIVRSPCCPANGEPVAPPKDYVERGRETDLDGYPCYEVGSGPSKVVVLPDIFGWRSGRTRQFCDELAEEGLHAILPNLFHDDGGDHTKPLAAGFSGMGYLFKHAMNYPWELAKGGKFYDFSQRRVRDDLCKILPILTADGAKVGVLGFCFGGWLTVKACSLEGIDCGVALHPSMIMEGWHGRSEERAYKDVRVPLMCLASKDEGEGLKPDGLLHRTLQEKGLDCEVLEFKEMGHGWAIRGDLAEPAVARDVQKAIDSSVSFLRKHLSRG